VACTFARRLKTLHGPASNDCICKMRILKTHPPVDALVLSPQAKSIHIGRDLRAMVWSLIRHRRTASQL